MNYHHIDSKNWFLQKIFESDNRPFLKNCLRCKQLITTSDQKAKHDFLKHYSEGKIIPFEEKPLDIIKNPALSIHQIEYKKYSNIYSFDNSAKRFDDFWKNVKQRFHATNKKWFKCSITIENTQNSISANLEPLVNTRYWTTETYDSVYFNDYILHSLKFDILKHVINNQMSGSSWYFKRFLSLAVKILDSEVEILK